MQVKTWNLEPNGKFLKQSPDFKMKEKAQLRSQMTEIWFNPPDFRQPFTSNGIDPKN